MLLRVRRPALLTLLAAPLYLKLSEGMSQSGTDHGGFFVIDVLSEASLSATTGFLGFRFVDVLCANGHVGENGDAIGSDLNESASDGQKIIATIFARDYFAGDDLRH